MTPLWWHDVMRGFGWEDICQRHDIKESWKQDYVRESVLYHAKKRKPRKFSVHRFRRVSGYQNVKSRWVPRQDRPIKRYIASNARQSATRFNYRNHVPLFHED